MSCRVTALASCSNQLSLTAFGLQGFDSSQDALVEAQSLPVMQAEDQIAGETESEGIVDSC